MFIVLECGSGLQAALSSTRLTILVRMVADYQIDLLDDEGHTVSTFITKRGVVQKVPFQGNTGNR